MSSGIEATTQRRRLLVQGLVQGVGFRPFVYTQAVQRGLTGFVLNDSNGVTIEVEGNPLLLDAFQHALHTELPPLARIDALTAEALPSGHDSTFHIAQSHTGAEAQALITPDTTTCADCLHELFDPQDRRYGYPFINCTNCGPRFTLVQDVPYDRCKTTMSVFQMCPTCQQEYDDPLNRRFHAQPNACSVCGPHVELVSLGDSHVYARTEGAVEAAAQLLLQGSILAIKGLGGYHLACNALDTVAVQRLRQRKRREAKPFALMVADLQTAQRLCYVNEAEAALLQAYQRPIVLLKRQENCPVAPPVAAGTVLVQYPETDRRKRENLMPLSMSADTSNVTRMMPNTSSDFALGIMLPYTPLHHLLLHAVAAKSEVSNPAVLVMTSGNLSDEPIAYRDEDAQARLASIADAALIHNRPIQMRCDDSVMRIAASGPQFFRRSRGYAPVPLALSFASPMPLLACGGHLKNTFCLGKQRQAFVSQHIGDLDNVETFISFREDILHFQRLFAIYPQAVAYDLHPDYLATRYAQELDVPLKIGIQHHHAHIASVIAEHDIAGPVIGVAADGTGYGSDGAIWGCEIMIADLRSFERQVHLAYVPLPGGEQAIKQPWRCAAVYLQQAYGDAFLALDIAFVRQLDTAKWSVLKQMIARGLNCPQASSLGRLFDAVAALLGLRNQVLYEGQAAIELEMLAQAHMRDNTAIYPCMLQAGRPAQWDVSPMLRAIVDDIQHAVPVAQIAARFHASIAEMLVLGCCHVRDQSKLNSVALSGGVFQNRLLLERLVTRLEELAFQVYINRRVPPNDGGLSFGQFAIAAQQLQK